MADAYHWFLTFTFIANAYDLRLQKGLSEARNKFLSSYYIENAPVADWLDPDVIKRYQAPNTRRYLCGDYYSEGAIKLLKSCGSLGSNLRFEHIVPKAAVIQSKCEQLIQDPNNPLTPSGIKDMLDKYWHIAVILTEEDRLLHPHRNMPKTWDPIKGDILARYRDDDTTTRVRLYRSREDATTCQAF